MAADSDRHLLFGLLALQNGIINQGQLLAAFQAWTLDKSKSLADHLEARGDLTGARGGAPGGTGGRSPRSARGRCREEPGRRTSHPRHSRNLAELGEPEIDATLARVARSKDGAATDTEDDDPERTGTFSVGSATSEGQRFRILRPHARGGLGAVFLALDGEFAARWR